MAKPMRTPESRKSSKTIMDMWMERGVFERWSRTEALNTGMPIFRSRWVDGPLREKSWCDLRVCGT